MAKKKPPSGWVRFGDGKLMLQVASADARWGFYLVAPDDGSGDCPAYDGGHGCDRAGSWKLVPEWEVPAEVVKANRWQWREWGVVPYGRRGGPKRKPTLPSTLAIRVDARVAPVALRLSAAVRAGLLDEGGLERLSAGVPEAQG